MDKRKGYFLQGRTIPQKFETDQEIFLALGHGQEKNEFPHAFLTASFRRRKFPQASNLNTAPEDASFSGGGNRSSREFAGG